MKDNGNLVDGNLDQLKTQDVLARATGQYSSRAGEHCAGCGPHLSDRLTVWIPDGRTRRLPMVSRAEAAGRV